MNRNPEDRWFAFFMSALLLVALCFVALEGNEAWFESWKADVERNTGCHVEENACRGCTPLTPPMRHLNAYWLRCDEEKLAPVQVPR